MVPADVILRQYEPYRSMTADEIEARVEAAKAARRLQHWTLPGEGDITFTWARPGKQRNILKLIEGDTPDEDFWSDFDPTARLWIVDMAATPGVKGYTVGRFLSWALAETHVATVGEIVLFRRNGGINPGRYGKAIVRG